MSSMRSARSSISSNAMSSRGRRRPNISSPSIRPSEAVGRPTRSSRRCGPSSPPSSPQRNAFRNQRRPPTDAVQPMTDSDANDPRGEPQVLLIEDDDELAKEIKAELQSHGYQVRHVATMPNGAEAIRIGADILVMDRVLQGVDGLSMLETL